MDETVDSFLKEINEIVPPKNVWEECYDENSGFPYYWNTQTDDVTWDVPDGYKKPTNQTAKTSSRRQLYIPPPSEEKLMLGSIPHVNKDNVKIYKIDEISKTNIVPTKKHENKCGKNKIKYPRKPSSESEDEKIVLISSYGTDTSSDEESKIGKNDYDKTKGNNIQSSNAVEQEKSGLNNTCLENKLSSPYDSEDETDILTQIQTKAKVLKQLGGEIPEGVKRLVNDTAENPKKEVTGFSLVAGYGDDSDEESECEEQTNRNFFPTEEQETVNTLFPAAKSVDISQFCENDASDKSETVIEENVDVKAFQRKRRIGVSLVNVQKKQVLENENNLPGSERPGFGFKGGTSKEYPGFKSAGIIFTKAEGVVQSVDNDVALSWYGDEKLIQDINELHNTLNEKLKFLCEGHNPALPVQIMIIQIETLYTAMKEKCLKPTYLKKWLNNTCEDLTKLEQQAAPAGWLLQWDRMHKRYYYHNQTTGENQWQYPQPDIVGVDEAMDISTTPPPQTSNDEEPPSESMNLILPPPPPQIKEKSVSPPPPPVISDYKITENFNNGEPFPPGVDDAEIQKIKDCAEVQTNKDHLTSELNSFYSDIATMESVQVTKQESQPNEGTSFKDNVQLENIPVKKKKKIKMGQGLAMKKKGVSKLVEKWKNVQKSYN